MYTATAVVKIHKYAKVHSTYEILCTEVASVIQSVEEGTESERKRERDEGERVLHVSHGHVYSKILC